jgi:hypothetical protein
MKRKRKEGLRSCRCCWVENVDVQSQTECPVLMDILFLHCIAMVHDMVANFDISFTSHTLQINVS